MTAKDRDAYFDSLIERLRAPWNEYDGKGEILCAEAADALELMAEWLRKWNGSAIVESAFKALLEKRAPGVFPPKDRLHEDGVYYWMHAERSSHPGIAQWLRGKWQCIGEAELVTPQELMERGWELLGPAQRPFSKYLDS